MCFFQNVHSLTLTLNDVIGGYKTKACSRIQLILLGSIKPTYIHHELHAKYYMIVSFGYSAV